MTIVFKKVFLPIFACLLLVVGGVLLTACGEEPEQPKTYSITLPSSNDYVVEADKQTAQEGESVTLTVTLNNAELEIISVSANDEACDQQSQGTYVFTMPAADVAITVRTQQIQEVYQSGIVSWAEDVPTYVSAANDGETWGTVDFDFVLDYQIYGGIDATITSTNQDVISNDVLEDLQVTSSSAYLTSEGGFTLNCTDLHPGTTYLIMQLKSGSVSAVNDTLIKKVVVVEYGELDQYYQPQLWDASVTVNLPSSDFAEFGKITVQVNDMDQPYGVSNSLGLFTAELQEGSESVTLNIKYFKGHDVHLNVYFYSDEYRQNMFFDLPEVVTGFGSSETGFNTYIDGVLSFAYNGGSISITPYTTIHM